ncbi:MAG: Dabb family protein [Actinomycetota bacterium]
MHVHIVLVRLEDPGTRPECMRAMRSMEGRIDGMVGLECRANELEAAESYDVMLRTTFVDRAAYESYRTDPVHVEVATLVRSLMSDAATLDWTPD